MTTQMYLQGFLIALLGALLATLFKIKGLKDKAKLANVEFSLKSFFADDWISLLISLVCIIISLLLADKVLKLRPAVTDYIQIGFVTVGYMGGDLASRLFGYANKRINAAIDYKTTIADTATGNLDAPTPAVKP